MHDFPVTDPRLPALFDPRYPNSPALWATLEGHHPGRALVDDPQRPTQCVVRTCSALAYFSDGMGQAFLEEAIALLTAAEPVWLAWPHETALRPPAGVAAVAERIEFLDCDPGSEALAALRGQVPAGCEVRAIDAELLERCEWRDEMANYAGSLENFLAHDMGFCLLRGDEILAEVYAAPVGGPRAEIGALTRESYRGRNYAPVTCAYLVKACTARGLEVYWSCDADNGASMRVAEKLGFARRRPYRIYEFGPT